jgi:Protein of unknown function (DUF3891)
MIVRSELDTLVVVRQVDHQAQCGALARAWGNETFLRIDAFDALVMAADVHDEGWREWEAAPQVDAHGRPMDFPDLDRPTHLALYEHGIQLAERHGPRVGLVVSMHGQGLHEKRLGLDGEPPHRETRPASEQAFLAAQDDRQRELAVAVGDPEIDAWAWAGFRLLQAWDTLSLYLLWRGLPVNATWTLPQVPRHVGDPGVPIVLRPARERECTVDPWPFGSDVVSAPVAGRRIPDRHYASDADLSVELARRPVTDDVFVLRPFAAAGR